MVFWTAVSALAAAGTLAFTALKPSSEPAPPAPAQAGQQQLPATAPVGEPEADNPAPPPATPEEDGHARVPSSQTEREAEAMKFAVNYWEGWSRSNEEALVALDHLYGEEMDFYGNVRSHQYVLREKTNMARRWPRREYVVDSSSLQASCRDDGYCEVVGRVAWSWWLRDGTFDREGLLRFRFGIRDGRIVSESGAPARQS